MTDHPYTSLNFSSQPTIPPSITIMNIMSEIMVIRALYVATRLRLAEYIGDRPVALSDLAASVKSDPTTLLSLLRALASIGIFAETDPQAHTFANTPLSRSLHYDAPDSMRAIVLLWGADYQWNAWQRLEATVKTGQAAFPAAHGGKTIWSYLEAHPDDEHIFSTAMTAMSHSINPLILEHYDFSPYRIVVDIGGGYASLLHGLLARYSQLSAILLDRSSVVEDVKVLYPNEGIPRLHVVAGDFFKAQDIPPQASCYCLKHVLVDWSDEHCRELLSNCHHAMAPTSKLLVIEQVIPEGPGASFAKFFDLQMRVMLHGGHQRTEHEFRELFQTTGLSLERIIPIGSDYSILELVHAE